MLGYSFGRPWRAGIDPLLEGFEIFLRKRFFAGRHFQVADVGRGLIQKAVSRVSRLDSRTSLAPGQHCFFFAQIETRHLRRAVA